MALCARPAPRPPQDTPCPAMGRGRHLGHRIPRRPRLDHPAAARPPPRAGAVPATAGERGRWCIGGHGRIGPDRPRPGRTAGPAPGVARGRGPARRHDPPACHRRGRYRRVPHRRVRTGVPACQPQGVPGRLRCHLAALGTHRTGFGGGRHRCVLHPVDRVLHPLRRPPQPAAPLVDRVLGGIGTLCRDHHDRPPRTGRPVPRPCPAHDRPVPGGGDALPLDPPSGRSPAGLGTSSRVPCPRHREAPRCVDLGLLRTPFGQAVVLPPRQPGRLRRLRRRVPDLPGPDRPPKRTRPDLGRLPGLRRRPRVDDGGHGGRRTVAPHLPGLGDAQHLPWR